MPRSSAQRGFLLALLGTTLFSCKGILIKLCYQHGATPDVVIALRMAFAFPFYVAVAWHERHVASACDKKLLLKAAGFGLMGYFVSSLLDMYGLLYISASLERIILYSYPTMTLLLTVWFLQARLQRPMVLWIGLIYGGLALVFLNPARSDSGQARELWIGSGLVFAAAFAYAIFLVATEVLLKTIPHRLFTALAMLSASGAIFLYAGLRLELAQLLQQAPVIYWLALLIAIFCTVLPSFIVAAAIDHIGAARTGAIGSAGPLITLGLATLMLGESITPLQLLGFVIVMVGIYRLRE